MRYLFAISLLVVLIPNTSNADGYAYPSVGDMTDQEIEVIATGQRAILWNKDSQFEIHIQPTFSRENGGAAWVVPFSAQPTIEKGNRALFDTLEILTAPVIIQYCTEPYSGDESGFGCSGDDDDAAADDGESGQLEESETDILILETGEVGALDYVVLSASDGDSLVDWLTAEEYQIPDEASELLLEYEASETFFFVSRLSPDADAKQPMPPVKFVLPKTDTPTYPLRMTALGVDGGDKLDLTVWFISDTGVPWGREFLPSSHPLEGIDNNFHDIRSIEDYKEAEESFFENNTEDTLLVFWGFGETGRGNIYYDLETHSLNWGDYYLNLDDLDIDIPSEFGEIMNDIRWADVYRYQARFSNSALDRDLVFEEVELPYFPSRWYTYSVGTCESDDSSGCQVTGGNRRSGVTFDFFWFLLAMIIVRSLVRKIA